MATRTRDERRRGASPSNAPPSAQRRTRPNPPPLKAGAAPVPNYLRPTASSGTDTAASKQQGKKPVASTSTLDNKPIIARRRSFDRPPPPSSSSSASPPVRTSSGNPLRSSSKTATAVRRVSQKNTEGKQKQPGSVPAARPRSVVVKKTTAVKKREVGSGSDTEKERTGSPVEKMEVLTDLSEADTLSDNPESPVAGAAVIVTQAAETDDDNDTGARGLLLPPEENQETVAMDPVIVLKEEEEEESVEIHDDINTTVAVNTEIHSVTIEAQTSPHMMEKEENQALIHQTKESNGIQETPNPEIELEPEIEEKTIQEEEAELTTPETNVIVIQETATEEKPIEQDGESEETVAMESQAPSPAEAVRGKKESAAMSNDVIEETAKQLREQRKNRVRALAGAFETVISMQDPK